MDGELLGECAICMLVCISDDDELVVVSIQSQLLPSESHASAIDSKEIYILCAEAFSWASPKAWPA